MSVEIQGHQINPQSISPSIPEYHWGNEDDDFIAGGIDTIRYSRKRRLCLVKRREDPEKINPRPTAKEFLRGELNYLGNLREGSDYLLYNGRLRRRGKAVVESIYDLLHSTCQADNQEISRVVKEKREEISQQVKLIRKGLRKALTIEWKEAEKKKRGNKIEFNKELKERVEENEAFKQLKLERRILSSIEQRVRFSATEVDRNRIRQAITEKEIADYQVKLTSEGKQLNHQNVSFIKEALVWKQLKEERQKKEKERALVENKKQVKTEIRRGRLGVIRDNLRETVRRIRQNPRYSLFSSLMAALRVAEPMLPAITAQLVAQEQARKVPGITLPLSSLRVKAEEGPELTTREFLSTAVYVDPAEFKPEEIMPLLLEGKVPLQEAVASHLNRPPIHFVDQKTGYRLGEYQRVLNIQTDKPPERLMELLGKLEGPIGQEPLEFLAKIGFRNLKRLITGKGAYSGASDPAIQLMELIGGFYPFQALFNEQESLGIHHPEAYCSKYFTKLVGCAFSNGEIPEEVKKEFYCLEPSSLLNGENSDGVISVLCAKMESYLAAGKLIENYGKEEVLKTYLNYVPLAATKEGMEIYGLAGGSQYLFGKSLEELNEAQMLVLIGLIQRPAEYMYDEDSAVNRGLTLLSLLEKKDAISEWEAEKIKRDLGKIEFLYLLPAGYDNNWLNEDVMTEKARREIYQKLEELQAGRLPAGSVREGNSIKVLIKSPDLPKAQMASDLTLRWNILTPEVVERPSLQTRVEEEMSARLSKTDKNYVFILSDGRKIEIPFFEQEEMKNPGLAIALYDADSDQILGRFDQTNLLGEYPLLAGSTIKPFVSAFLLNEGYDLNQLIENAPGHYALVHEVLTVQNASDALNSSSPENKISLAQALAYSANVPFQKLLKEYLVTHEDGWQRFQDFMNRFGMDLKDVHGERLDSPTDYPAIGSDAYVANLPALARAYGILANPERYFAGDQKLIGICQKISQVLADDKLKRQKTPTGGTVWSETSLKLFSVKLENGFGFFKTGTVSANDKNSDLLAAGIMKTNDGRLIAIATRISGQENGQVTNLAGFGSSTPLPITREMLEFLAKNNVSAKESISPGAVTEDLFRLWQGKAKNDYRVMTVNNDTVVYDRFGNPVFPLLKSASVDLIGKNPDDFCQIAVHLGNGEVTTGFIKKESLSKFSCPTDENLSQLTGLISQYYPEVFLPEARLVSVGPNERSPFLTLAYESLKERKMVMAGPEDLRKVIGQAGFIDRNTVFVNEELMRTYLGKKVDPSNLTAGQKALIDIFVHQGEHLKQQTILEQSGTNLYLDELLWDNDRAMPAQKIIDVLTEYRLGLSDEPKLQSKVIGDLLKYYPKGRLTEIFKLYSELMARIDQKASLTKGKAQRLVELLIDLNNSATNEERKVLGISDI